MKLCPVVPPALIRNLPRQGSKTDIGYFAFASECRPGSAYGDFFLKAELLVIDCPIYEGEAHLEPYDLKLIEKYLHPTFLIVPDVRHDMKRTLLRFEQYIPILGPCATGVIQGKTLNDLIDCAREMAKATRKFAIPKDVNSIYGIPRANLLQILFDKGIFHPECEIHLLGGDWPYSDERACGHIFSQVKSFDTAEPFNAAYARQSMIFKPPARPNNFMKLDTFPGFRVFKRNIEQVIAWSH